MKKKKLLVNKHNRFLFSEEQSRKQIIKRVLLKKSKKMTNKPTKNICLLSGLGRAIYSVNNLNISRYNFLKLTRAGHLLGWSKAAW